MYQSKKNQQYTQTTASRLSIVYDTRGVKANFWRKQKKKKDKKQKNKGERERT